MSREKYIDDLKEIKDIMDRSTRFLSLSGLSGISTGITALTGAYLAHRFVFKDYDYLVYHTVDLNNTSLTRLVIIAVCTLILSIGVAIYFTRRKTKTTQQRAWDIQTKKLVINLLIPLITGGVLCVMLLFNGYIAMLIPLSLLFYGLALVNGSHYTIKEIRYLGLLEIILGLIAFIFIQHALFFWALGFGVLQILYGLMIQRKY